MTLNKMFSGLVVLIMAIAAPMSATRYKAITVNDQQGLCNNYVRSVLQDDYGYLWLATLNGLNRYDGYNMRLIRPQDYERYRLMMDSRTVRLHKWGGRFLWVMVRPQTYTCYDLKTGHFIDYTGDRRRLRSYKGNFDDPNAVWLWYKDCGALRLTEPSAYKKVFVRNADDGQFSCQEFRKSGGGLPTDDVEDIFVLPTPAAQHPTAYLVLGRGLACYDKGTSTGSAQVMQILDRTHIFKAVGNVGDRVFAASQDGGIFCVTGGRLRQVAQVPSKVSVNSAVGIRGRLLITTTGDNYCYYPGTGAVSVAKDIPGRNSKILIDNRKDVVVYNNDCVVTYISAVNKSFSPATFRLSAKPLEDARLCCVTDRRGTAWISVWGNGLYSYDTRGKALTHYLMSDPGSIIKSNNILDLAETRDGQIVASQENFGVSIIYSEYDNVTTWDYPGGQLGTNANGFRALNNIDGVLYAMNLDGNVAAVPSGASGRPSFIHSQIVAMYKARNGDIWYGTRDDGAYCVTASGQQIHYTGKQLGILRISQFCEDSRGRMWIATFGGGLVCVSNGKLYHLFNKGSRELKECRVITKDHNGNIWLGTGEGAFIFNPDKILKNPKAVTHYVSNDFNAKLDEVHDIFEDAKHRVWIAYAGNGVSMIDNSLELRAAPAAFEQGKALKESLEKAKHFTTADGLRNDGCASICADRKGRIWVGTSPGMNLFNEKTGKFRQFVLSDEYLETIVMQNTMMLMPDGRIAYGSRDGVVFFSPDKVLRNAQGHGTYLSISDIYINGTRMAELPDFQDAVPAFLTKELELSHADNSVTFKFTDFKIENLGQFSYWLEGYDKGWSTPSTSNEAVYNNLPSGTYTFHVRTLNPDGSPRGKECTMELTIDPPLWASWWAICLYVIAIAIAIAIAYRQIKKEHQLRLAVKIEHEMTELKLRMFTAISHEFRTPLTIIQGAVEHLKNDKHEVPASMRSPLDSMQKSVKRMSRLINELLVFRKVNAGSMQLGVEETDVVAFIRNIYQTFAEVADNKHINYIFSTQLASLMAYIDCNKVDTIVYNLISNAFKYTPQDGEVSIQLSIANSQLSISITDNGIGVPEEKREELFKEFKGSQETYQSIGLGLHLAKQLAEVHHGQLVYEDAGDEEHTGSRFSLLLPLDASVYAEEEKLATGNTLLEEERQQKAMEAEEMAKPGYKEVSGDPLNEIFVLLVEDDDDVRDYVHHELDRYFHVVTGCNGEEALKVLEEREAVDIIVTDMMMPVMDGAQFVKKVRGDERFAHLPIVMLTAMSDDKNRVKGLNAGADVYMEKPFSINVLVAQLTQLLRQSRSRLTSDSQHAALNAQQNIGVNITPGVITEERDRRMMSQIDSWLSQHISDPRMTVDDLAAAMGCGRSKLYAKMSDLTGQTPNNYIRTLRMNMTKDLLRDTDLTVSEIAYKVGFSNSFYLSKCFKDTFGMSPTQYRKS